MPRRRNTGPVLKPCPTNRMRLMEGPTEASDHIAFTPETGGSFIGTVEEINGLLTAMGYHEVTVRRNLMSRIKYLEAKGTPLHCSPASETYWSM